MRKTFSKLMLKLTCALILSSAVFLGSGVNVRAHEVMPTIADLSVSDGSAHLTLRINLEAFLAGIDLDTVVDTNNAENAGDYDSLRAQPARQIAARAPELLETWNKLPLLQADGQPAALETVSITIPEDVNMSLPRIAQWELSAPVPTATNGIVVSWPSGSGALVVRQQGVEEPYTGYLEGGTQSPEIVLGGGGQQTAGQAFATYVPVGFDHIVPKGLDHILYGHAGAWCLGVGGGASVDRRAVDRGVDRLCRGRKYFYFEIVAVATFGDLWVWITSRARVRFGAWRVWSAARSVHSGVDWLQHWGRDRPANGYCYHLPLRLAGIAGGAGAGCRAGDKSVVPDVGCYCGGTEPGTATLARASIGCAGLVVLGPHGDDFRRLFFIGAVSPDG
ncbi:hypothetical protein LCGC14_0774790 [marine sediment metagenome]|uniref:Uncharacterized protein n=1 Tax=marine sediment metagenome TaxID=412755 RepID=A0A0F9Q1H3_9ZZZZ